MIGGLLARKWQLPGELVETIRHHHQPDGKSESYNMQALIYMADTIVHYFDGGADYSLEAYQDSCKEIIRPAIELSLVDVYDWYPNLSDDIGEACDMILGTDHTCRQKAQELN